MRDRHSGGSTQQQGAEGDPLGMRLTVVKNGQIPVAVVAVATLGKVRGTP
jgi:hypothetical protein